MNCSLSLNPLIFLPDNNSLLLLPIQFVYFSMKTFISKRILNYLFISSIILSSNLQPNTVFAQSFENAISAFEDYLDSYYKVKNVPSVSAGVLKGDSIIWIGTRGYINLENSIPANTNSVYRIASISKSITAVAIMQLWEKGLVNLDADVRNYIPHFPKKKWVFTIRQLLNHTSGIRSYREGEFNSKAYYQSTREALKVFEKDSLIFKPGTDYLYTTLGYTLLAAVIESVTEKSFTYYVKENILNPSGMVSTYVDVHQQIIPNRVSGYIKNSSRRLENAQLADLSIKVAGGGYVSTVNDLLLFAKSLLDGKLIKQETLESMTVPTKIGRNFLNNYGLGFALPSEKNDFKFYHAGLGTGFTSKLLIDPVSKSAAVHLINISDRNLENPADELLNILKELDYTTPGYIISDTLMSYYYNGGLDSVYSKLSEIIDNDSVSYSFDMTDLAGFGRDLIQLKKNIDALDYLKRINRMFPNTFEILVALADAYHKDNNKGLALRNFRIANQIDQHDRYVNSMIRRLSQ